MKAILVVCAIFLFDCALLQRQFSPFSLHRRPIPTGPRRANAQANLKNITQKVDHFDSEDTATWTQYYYENREFFNETNNNVVFLLLGGEDPIHENNVLYGSWTGSAKKYGALLIQLEHRFYGDSQPFSDLSTENLKYLTSDQALADAANFIKNITKEYKLADDVQWIVYGGSYSGSLAAWMRLKHPDLVTGAVSSSAPLLAKADFTEYYDVVVDDLDATSGKCVYSIKTAMSQIEKILNDPTAEQNVTTILNVCSPIEGLDSDDVVVESFYNSIALAFSNEARVHLMQGHSLKTLCDIMTDETKGTEMTRLKEVLLFTGTTGEDFCMGNNYWGNVQYWQRTDIFGGSRQWMFQTCNEFGWFQPSRRDDAVFGKGCPTDFLENICSDVFGEEFNKAYIADKIEQINTKYGAKDIDVTNVVFVHGTFDPWHPLGITETKNKDAPAILVEGTSHCADTLDADANELPALTEAKKEIDRLVGVWLGVT